MDTVGEVVEATTATALAAWSRAGVATVLDPETVETLRVLAGQVDHAMTELARRAATRRPGLAGLGR